MGQEQVQMAVQVVKCPKKIKVKTPFKPRARKPNRPLTQEQVRRVMLTIDNLRDAALLDLGFNCGPRVSEPLTFGQDAIDWEQGSINIWDEKKNEYRRIWPPRETLARLKQWINQSKPGPNRVFGFNAKTAERIVQRWTLSVLGEARSWHTVRHTYINLCAELEQDIKIVCANTGDSITTILHYYRKPSPGYIRRKVEENPIYSEVKKEGGEGASLD